MQRIEYPGKPFDHGLGWFRPHGAGASGAEFVQHLGGGAGFFNVMRLYPARSLGIVVMGNATRYDLDGLVEAIASADGS